MANTQQSRAPGSRDSSTSGDNQPPPTFAGLFCKAIITADDLKTRALQVLYHHRGRKFMTLPLELGRRLMFFALTVIRNHKPPIRDQGPANAIQDRLRLSQFVICVHDEYRIEVCG
jgi:hypothetical protein